jgi:hypothetical protein
MGTATVLDDILEPLSRCLDAESARRLVELHVPETVQERMNHFAELANEGLLTTDQREEYQALINAADIVSILKIKAKRQFPDAR